MNIEPSVGIAAIKEWIEITTYLPESFPAQLILEALDIMMNRNVFQFDNTYWHHHVGTAMSTPCAYSYATLSYAIHELLKVISLLNANLAFLK
jgi:hypothetical protein